MACNPGKILETLIEASAKDQGIRTHRNTPGMTITGTDKRTGRKVGFAHASGRLDFDAFYGPTWLTFDAKSSANPTSFPLKNIERHQAVIVEHLAREGRIGFFLVEFSTAIPQYFALTWDVLGPRWHSASYGGPQSIPRRVFEAECMEIRRHGNRLDLKSLFGALTETACAKAMAEAAHQGRRQ